MMPSRDKTKHRGYQHKHYQNNKEYYKNKRAVRRIEMAKLFKEYKDAAKCVLCSEDDSICIDYHHLDPSKKDKLISKMVGGGTSWSTIRKELQKCIPLCANCHRKVHAHPDWAKKIGAAGFEPTTSSL